MDFETARESLATWYRLGRPKGDPHFNAFFTGWLAPQVRARGRAMRMAPELVDDALQVVAEYFANREALVGLQAESAAFWRRQISWKLTDVLRRANRTQQMLVKAVADAETGTDLNDIDTFIDPAPDPEQRLRSAELQLRQRDALHGALNALSPVERVALIAHTWPIYEELATPADYQLMGEGSGLTVDQVRGQLNDALPLKEKASAWSRATARALFPAADLDSDREGTLDTYRQRRTRAAKRLRSLNSDLLDRGDA